MQNASQSLVFRDLLPLLRAHPEYVEPVEMRLFRRAKSLDAHGSRQALVECDDLWAYFPLSPDHEQVLRVLALIHERAEVDAKRLGGTGESRRAEILTSLNLDKILDFNDPAAIKAFEEAGQTPDFEGLCQIQNWYLLTCAIVYGLKLPASTMRSVARRPASPNSSLSASNQSMYVLNAILSDEHVPLPFLPVRLETYKQRVDRFEK